MIAKHIATPQGGSGYQRLSGYVLNVRQEHRDSTDPASWSRLGAYILDTPHEGEKVAWARAVNCGSDDPGWAVRDILNTQQQNTRATADKSYHLVVSFPEGERPTRSQVEDIEDQLCGALGYGEHQRVSAVHQNTDNWHLHVAINKVHPTTLRNVTPIRDHFLLQAACAELEIKHGLTKEPHTLDPRQARENKARGRAADFEARHGGQSFIAWTQEHARPALLAARDARDGWQAVHQVAATLDLAVKLRGAGLVIGHRTDSRLHVKASDVDRGLSLKAMTDLLGRFEPPGQPAQTEKPQGRYQRPIPGGDLYAAFKDERDQALRARESAAAELTARHRTYAKELAAWYRARMRQEHAQGLKGAVRRESFQHIAGEREKDRRGRLKRERDERRQVRDSHKVPNWQGYLEAEAAKGNEDALRALRSRQRRTRQLEADLLTAADAVEARHVVSQHMKPSVRRDGRVVYRVIDGGVVLDEAEHVRVPHSTTAATFLALSLATERFGTRPLVVKGSEEFRNQLARVAALEGMTVTFADPAMERQRAAIKEVDHGTDRGDTTQRRRRSEREGDRGR